MAEASSLAAVEVPSSYFIYGFRCYCASLPDFMFLSNFDWPLQDAHIHVSVHSCQVVAQKVL